MMTSRKLLIMDSKHSQPERIVRRITSVSTNLILPVEKVTVSESQLLLHHHPLVERVAESLPLQFRFRVMVK